MVASKVSHYKIIEKLGAGGMGEVYLAEDSKLGRKVALKILSEEFTTNRDRLSRFEQEASAASALNHPNILTIHEVGFDEGHHFIATEYIDGATLRRRIASGPIELKEMLDISVQVASALEEAHAAGIIHRDIKPDNIMIRRNGYVKVLDFGLAKLTDHSTDSSILDGEAATRMLVHTSAGVVMGTSHYMSPEQARGKPVDGRSDIWSLGVVMYEMVAGRTPFEGETSTDVVVAITQREPAPLARFAPTVPAEIDWIIAKALRKDREERYQTIKELLTDLRRLKQRLEFEAELERSVAPDSITRSSLTSLAGSPTVPEKALPTVAKTVSHVSSAEYIVNEIKQHKLGAGLLAALFMLAVGAGVFLYFRHAQALTDKDTILIADFINTTGEPVFDGTLKQALSVQLGQSSFLNIFPEERVRETLRFMGRSPDERVTKDIGREIAERQGIKALLVGSIAPLGSHYAIMLDAVNARTGDPIAREQIEADSKEKVLTSLGSAATNLRQKLGESLSAIKKSEVPIEQATTSSLEALKAYAMGNEARMQGKGREAAAFYQRAIALDQNFAMAYGRLAVFYGNMGQLESAKQYAEKAFALRDRVSERERLYISEKYYNYVTGEIDKAVEVLQSWASQYPSDFIPHNNLALNYMYFARYEDALKEALEATRLSPNATSARDNLIGSFIGLGRFDEAEQANNELRKLSPDYAAAHFVAYFFAFFRGDKQAMVREAEWFKGKPEEAEFTSTVAATELFNGRLKSAETLTRQAVDMLKKQDRKENAAQNLINLGANQALMGNGEVAKKTVNEGLSLARTRMSLSTAALVFASCNDSAKAQSLLDELMKTYPKDTLVAMQAALTKAQMEKSKGNLTQAMQLLDSAKSYDMGFITGSTNNYLRGELYLQQHLGNEAAAEFQKIIDHQGIDGLSATHPLSHLGLGRAAIVRGDTATARKEYQNFFALWKDADPDLPVLIQAKKEYESIK